MLVITGAFVERTCEARAMAGRSIVLDFDGAVDGDVRPVDTVIGDSVETDAGKKGGMVTAELDVKEPAAGAAAVLIEVADGAGGGEEVGVFPCAATLLTTFCDCPGAAGTVSSAVTADTEAVVVAIEEVVG